ncbi:MAG: nuclear transport factor 2 family protein [Dehalococcoidales bacterium]|nr:nuclear transport factor 2 family protein [Dehalococcoidales bacterium]
MVTNAASKLAALEEKVQELADKEEIRDLLARYSFCCDLNRNEDLVNLFTEDGVFATDTEGVWSSHKGRPAIMKYFNLPLHQELVFKSQHLLLDNVITVNGNKATAVGYILLTDKWVGGYDIFRCAIRSWAFQRVNGHWLIKDAKSVAMGNGCEKLVPKDLTKIEG